MKRGDGEETEKKDFHSSYAVYHKVSCYPRKPDIAIQAEDSS
jgi:hypothetical protein